MDINTKISKVKEYLESGNYIDDAKAVELCHNYRLSSTIHELRRRHGLNIQDRWVENNGYKYTEYSLVEEK